MTNATALIQGLSGERVRWTEASKGFQAQIHRLVGDVLLCTGFLSYTGPFNQEFRNLILKNWKKEMIAQKIPFSDVSLLGYLLGEQFMKSNKILSSRQDVLSVIYWFENIFYYTRQNSDFFWLLPYSFLQDLQIVSMLVDNATVSEWNLEGLPNDELSIQNGLIVTKASRFPLLIDPQGQGKSWIKKREGKNELQVSGKSSSSLKGNNYYYLPFFLNSQRNKLLCYFVILLGHW